MNQKSQHSYRVGEIRPSQLMHTYGVGAIVDLPKLSVIVTGLEDWPTDPQYAHTIVEDRLLMAVRYQLPEVNKLLAPPTVPDTGMPPDPFDSISRIGVPVATFPRWMVCPMCRRLAPIKSGLFKIKEHPYHPDRTVYRHENCNKGRSPEVVPARFLVTCENGHLDDFPWVDFVHQGKPCSSPLLKLIEYGASGEARDLEVRCETCEATRRLSDAFGRENRDKLPMCRGRRPHLRDYDLETCGHHMRPIVLGASNTWFPVVYSTVAIPVKSGRLAQLVGENWADLQNVTTPVIIAYKRSSGQLGELSEHSDDEIWQAIETRRKQDAGEIPPPGEQPDLKEPEWQVFTHSASSGQAHSASSPPRVLAVTGQAQFDPNLNTDDFQLRPVAVPEKYTTFIDQVVLVEKLREVRAMVGFTRLDAMGELTDPDLNIQIDPAPLSRRPSTWVPAAEVRGEGIFIQFSEATIQEWLARPAVRQRGDAFLESHKKWRAARYIEQTEAGFPGMRYVLIHSFAHALMRQLALECGYAVASIRERIYARPSEKEGGPMAGLLMYTSAPDSEGTLGGLVGLGEPGTLGRHIGQALETAHLCASDPLCAEHPPSRGGRTLHAAACHACLFAPETSCERGNKYLDRSTLVKTVEHDDLAFFE